MPREVSIERGSELGIPESQSEMNIFRALLHHPPLARLIHQFGQTLYAGYLTPRQRELIIMRVGWVTGSYYELSHHFPVALRSGLSNDELLRIRDWNYYAHWAAGDRALLHATDLTLSSTPLDDETWSACHRALGDVSRVIELLLTIGAWQMISGLLRTLEIPLESSIGVWPPGEPFE
jgi:alkylhydroperoxidase family enzyme